MPVIINGTTGISGPDGSVSSPAVEGSDADTGFFFTAGKIGASLNGVEANVPLVSGTAQNSTSGTSIDFTGIPSWVKRITVMLEGVSTNGTSNIRLQLGTSSGVTTSGYLAASSALATGVATSASTSGFDFNEPGSAANIRHGSVAFSLLATNRWVANGGINYSDTARTCVLFGSIGLSGTLDRIRITTVNGTDTFDAGSINIMYE